MKYQRIRDLREDSDLTQTQIGEKLNINRSTSYRHRRNSLEEIRKQLKEKKTNEE